MSNRELMAVTRALADENRVRILAVLQRGELCACQIIALLSLAPSTISRHLAILKQSGLIEGRKDGRWMHYRLADPNASAMIHNAIQWVTKALSKEKRIMEDAKRLKAILRMDPEDLCCRRRKATGTRKFV